MKQNLTPATSPTICPSPSDPPPPSQQSFERRILPPKVPRRKKFSFPRPGLTGSPSERAAQQAVHDALQLRDVHTAVEHLPAALGSSPENVCSVLLELEFWPAAIAPGPGGYSPWNESAMHRLFFLLALMQAAEAMTKKLLASSGSPDCFSRYHPQRGMWSARDASSKTRGYLLAAEQFMLELAKHGKYKHACGLSEQILELNRRDDLGMRFMIPIYKLHLRQPMDALRFILLWLDDTRAHLAAAVGMRPLPAGESPADLDLGLDMVQGRYHAQALANPRLPFLAALACWMRYCEMGHNVTSAAPVTTTITKISNNGTVSTTTTSRPPQPPVCKSARAWLRLAHKGNRHVLRLLCAYIADGGSTILLPTVEISTAASTADSYEAASDFILQTGGLFTNDPGVKKWVFDTAHVWVTNTCPGCGGKEAKVGEHRACRACRVEWYCGVGCQGAAWRAGHKGRCKEMRRIRKAREMAVAMGA